MYDTGLKSNNAQVFIEKNYAYTHRVGAQITLYTPDDRRKCLSGLHLLNTKYSVYGFDNSQRGIKE